MYFLLHHGNWPANVAPSLKGASWHMIRHFTTFSLLAFLASCTTQTTSAPKPAFDSSRNPDMLSPDLYPGGAVPEKEPVVRYGRYTLVSTLPDSGQRDLMAQIIDVNIPATMKPNVRDAMQYVMDRSGYSLCSADTGHVNILYTRPLPAAQYKLGPMTLRNTLQVLAGPAWQVKVDEVNRQICYVLRPGYQLPDSPRPALTNSGPLLASSIKRKPSSVDSTSSNVLVASVPTPTPISISAAAPSPDAAKTVLPPVAPPAKDGSIPVPEASSLASPPPGTAKPVIGPSSSVSKPVASVPAAPAPLVAAKPVAAPPPRPLPQVWTAETGSTLQETVEAWAKKANWQLIWSQRDLDYPIQAPLRFEGSFQDAIRELFPLYDNAPRSFVVDGSESGAQRVLHVAERKKK